MTHVGMSRTSQQEGQKQGEGSFLKPSRGPVSPDSYGDILGLQQSAGNQAVSQLLRSPQGKSTSDDHNVPPIVREVLRSPGQPLDLDTLAFMESHFDQDFSQVRIHRDAKAAESARTVNAKAYTLGQDVVFGEGQDQPNTLNSNQLLTHELVHVVQQADNSAIPLSSLKISSPTDASEREADKIVHQLADRQATASLFSDVSLAEAAPKITQSSVRTIARKEDDSSAIPEDRLKVTDEEEEVSSGTEKAPANLTGKATDLKAPEQKSVKQKEESEAHTLQRASSEWESHQVPIDDELLKAKDIRRELTLRLFEKTFPRYYRGRKPPRSDLEDVYNAEIREWTSKTPENIIRERVARRLAAGKQTIPYRSNRIPQAIERYEKIRQARARSYYRGRKYLSPTGRIALAMLEQAKKGQYDAIWQALDKVDWSERDDVALKLMEDVDKALLYRMAQAEAGRRLLDRLFDELTELAKGGDEQREANRILQAKARLIPPGQFERAVKSSATKIFPYESAAWTREFSPIKAERRSGGKIWVKLYLTRVGGVDRYKEALDTMPRGIYFGIELPENEIIGVKMYDLGGEIHYRPALYLIQIANESQTSTLSKAAEAFGTGLTLGSGALVATATRSQIFVWADRIFFGLEVITSVLKEHRGWIIQSFGNSGKEFLRYVDLVNSATLLYGAAQVVGMEKLMGGLRNAYRDWQSAIDVVELSSTQRQIVQQVSRETEELLENLAQAGKVRQPAPVEPVSRRPPTQRFSPPSPRRLPETPEPETPLLNPSATAIPPRRTLSHQTAEKGAPTPITKARRRRGVPTKLSPGDRPVTSLEKRRLALKTPSRKPPEPIEAPQSQVIESAGVGEVKLAAGAERFTPQPSSAPNTGSSAPPIVAGGKGGPRKPRRNDLQPRTSTVVSRETGGSQGGRSVPGSSKAGGKRTRSADRKKSTLSSPRLVASRQSLDTFLELVWQERETILREASTAKVPQNTIYNLYAHKPGWRRGGQALGVDRATYNEKLNKLMKKHNVRTVHPHFAFAQNRPHVKQGSFHHFVNRRGQIQTLERIYLQVHDDFALETMDFVLKDLLYNKNLPGIHEVKLTDWSRLSQRRETIVIYSDSPDTTQQALDKIRLYHQKNSTHFQDSTPPMTDRVFEGVSVGAQPQVKIKGEELSFGDIRSKAIYEALREAVKDNSTLEQFVQQVLEYFRKYGIDPDTPHLNLPTATVNQ